MWINKILPISVILHFDKNGLICFCVMGALFWLNILFFVGKEFLILIEFLFTQNIFVIGVTVIIAYYIAHIFHQKDKPISVFWNNKKNEVNNEICDLLINLKFNIRMFEISRRANRPIPSSEMEMSYNPNLSQLLLLCQMNSHMLTNLEVRRVGILYQSIQEYTAHLYGENNSVTKENMLMNIENVLFRLVMSFEHVPQEKINKLTLVPFSDFVNTPSLIESRENRMPSEDNNL